MTLTRSAVLALVTTVSTLAIVAPAAAQSVLFSTGTTPDGSAPATGTLSGQLEVRGGVTQVRTADGGLVSFVGDASVTVDGSTVRVANGKFTARAGSSAMRIVAPDGASASLPAGGAASLGVTAGGLTGRALSGGLSIATASGVRRFAAGDAFTASGRQVSAAVTAGAQPVSAAPGAAYAASDARPVVETENPQLPVFASGSRAQVLAQALGRRDAALGFDFDTVSRATADVNLAYLQAGGMPGGFTRELAGAALQQYLSAIRTGEGGTMPSALAGAYLSYFTADGLSGLAQQQRAIIDAYTRILASGGAAGTFNDTTIGNAYSDYIRKLAADAVETGLNPEAIAAYENYVRSLGLGDTYDAGRRAQIEAFQALQAAGGSPSAAVGVDVIDRYLAYLATGAAAEAYTGASSTLLASYLDYLKTVGFPIGTDPAAVERLLAFYAHLANGGSIGTLPGGGNGPIVQPPVEPVLPTARYAGTLYGFANGQTFSTDLPLVSVGIDTDGYPRTFDGLNRIDTARLVEARKDDRWVIGRYTDGKVRTTFSSGAREYILSPNESIHFGYATSVLPVTRTSGTARYGLAASTTPSYFDGAAVTASSLTAELAIAFGADPKFGITGVLTTTAGGIGQRYAFESAGGLAAPSLTIRRNNGLFQLNDGGTPVTTTDTRCFENCFFSPNLVASGADGDVVAGTYGIYANRTRGQILTGAAVFTPGATTTPPPPDPEQPSVKTIYAGAYLGRAGAALVGGGDSGVVEVGTDAAGYPRSFRGYQRVGTARLVNEAKGDGWVVGRYTDGTFITTSQGAESTQTLSPNESLHFAFGTNSAPFTGNRGTARYAVAGYTTPTYDDGRVATDATLTGGIAVQFGSQIKYGIEATLTTTVAGDALRYTIASAGGLAAPSLASQAGANGFYLFGQAGVRSTDGSCADACRFSANMFGSGADGQVIAGTYSIRSTSPVLTGGAVFTQNARDLTEPAPPVLTGAPTGSVDFAGQGAFAGLNGSSIGTQAIAAADGKLEQIRQDKRGTNTDRDFGGLAGAIGWTRWSGGTTESTFASGANTTIPENGGQHMVWGAKATNLPTGGTASYELAGSTKPTIADGSVAPGTLSGGALAVDFKSMRVGYDLSVQFGGSAYSLASRGGIAAPSVELLSDNRFESSFRNAEGPMISGNGCSGGNCYAEVRGFLAGPGASHAGLAYHFLSGPSGGIVSGAAAFSKNP